MVSKGDWAVVGIVIAALAGVGIALYLTRKPVAQGLTLKRVINQQTHTVETVQQNTILENEERVEIERNHDGSLKEIVIHRKVVE